MSTAHAGLALVSLALTAICWNTSVSPVANKLFTSAALEGNAGGYLVRPISLDGIGGECPEYQTPAWVNRDPYWTMSPTLKVNSHPTSICDKDLGDFLPLLFYMKHVKRWAAPSYSHSCSATTRPPTETIGCFQLGAIIIDLAGCFGTQNYHLAGWHKPMLFMDELPFTISCLKI